MHSQGPATHGANGDTDPSTASTAKADGAGSSVKPTGRRDGEVAISTFVFQHLFWLYTRDPYTFLPGLVPPQPTSPDAQYNMALQGHAEATGTSADSSTVVANSTPIESVRTTAWLTLYHCHRHRHRRRRDRAPPLPPPLQG